VNDIPFEAENIANSIKNFIATSKIMKVPLDPGLGRGVITDFIIPSKINIGDWHEVSAVYKGSVKSGYFSLMIQDRDGIKQLLKDSNSIGHKLLDSGQSVQIGTLNFSNGLYKSK
jgi:hypothetical protein